MFLIGILLGLFWEIQKWVGLQKPSLGNKKEQQAFDETAKLVGMQVKPGLGRLVQEVSTLPTETW